MYGGDLRSQLEQSLRSSFIDTGAAMSANWIGDQKFDNFNNKLAHAIAGCAVGAIKANDCGSGALGAAVGEMSAEWYGGNRTNGSLDLPGFQTDTVNFARMMAGIAVAITGGDANAINLAASTGGNAAENNYLLHKQELQWKQDLADCKGCSKQKIDEINASYAKLDKQQDKAAQRCIGDACAPITDALQQDIQDKKQAIVTECAGPTNCGLQYTNDIKHESDLLNGPTGTWARTDAISSLGTWADENIVNPYLDMRENNQDLVNRAGNGDENARQQLSYNWAMAFAGVGSMRVVGTTGLFAEQVAVREGVNSVASTIVDDAAASQATNVRAYPDGSLRTPDGKFASVSGMPAPGTVNASNYADFLTSNGINVVGTELEVAGPLGVRKYDIMTLNLDNSLFGIEIKSGGAMPTPYQEFSDMYVNQFGAIGRGRIAGQPVTGSMTIYLPSGGH